MKNKYKLYRDSQIQKRSIGLLLGLWCAVASIGCGGSGPQECTYDPPEPIFKDIEGFENHDFERTGKNASFERIDIPDSSFNLSIELYQSGCDILRQEYRIITHEPYEVNTPAPVCVAQIANIFRLLAERNPIQLGPLYGSGDVLLKNAQRFEYNENIPIREGGVFVQVDKVHQTNSAILTLVISE